MNMNEKQLLLLWQLRFEKILSNEEESLALYKALLREYDHLLAGSRIKHIIRKIMREEAEHISMAQKLLEIVGRKKSHEYAHQHSSLEVG